MADLTSIKKGDKVILRLFTGAFTGVKEVEKADKSYIYFTTRSGMAKFSKKTGKQVDPEPKNARFASYIDDFDEKIVAEEEAKKAAKATAKKPTKKAAKAKKEEELEELPESEEEVQEEEKASKPKKKVAKKTTKKKLPPKQDNEDDEDFEEID